ncbi:MAG: hypothetical protein AB7J63_14755 [Vicinamibacterales bacterium]
MHPFVQFVLVLAAVVGCWYACRIVLALERVSACAHAVNSIATAMNLQLAAFDRLVDAQAERLRIEAEHVRAVQQQTAAFLNTQETIRSLNAALQQSNERAAWYHQEASALRSQVQQLATRIHQATVLQ